MYRCCFELMVSWTAGTFNALLHILTAICHMWQSNMTSELVKFLTLGGITWYLVRTLNTVWQFKIFLYLLSLIMMKITRKIAFCWQMPFPTPEHPVTISSPPVIFVKLQVHIGNSLWFISNEWCWCFLNGQKIKMRIKKVLTRIYVWFDLFHEFK